jgi:hypothetical protein
LIDTEVGRELVRSGRIPSERLDKNEMKNDTENNLDRIQALLWAVGCSVFGFSALNGRIYESFVHGIIDLGKYHRIIGVGSICIGAFYLCLAIRANKNS